MKSLAPIAAAPFFAASALAQYQRFTINTPNNAVVCEPLLITWVGGTPPYFLSVRPGDQAHGKSLLDFGIQNGTSFTWIVNFPAGTSLGFNLRDTTGSLSQSAPFTVQSSIDTSCLNPSQR